jgi:hypothetical protein
MPYSVEQRRINNSKQNTVNRIHAKPTVNSLSEGEEVVYQGRNEPLARYRKEGGKLWVSYMTSDGNIYVPKNLDVDGIIFSSGEEVVQADSIVPTKAGGTGSDLSASTGAISISSGTVAAGTLAISNGGTNAADSNGWLNTRVVMTANGVLGYDASAVACTMNTLADANNIRARVTGSLASGNGLNTSIAIGDAVESFVIYNDSSVAGTSDDNTVSASTIWQQTDDTAVIKVIFNYYHEAESVSMKLSCMLRTTNSVRPAIATLAIYPFATGASLSTGSTADTGSAEGTPVTISSARENFDSSSLLSSSKMDITGLTVNTMYKSTIALHNTDAGGSEISYMTAPTVTVYGSS